MFHPQKRPIRPSRKIEKNFSDSIEDDECVFAVTHLSLIAKPEFQRSTWKLSNQHSLTQPKSQPLNSINYQPDNSHLAFTKKPQPCPTKLPPPQQPPQPLPPPQTNHPNASAAVPPSPLPSASPSPSLRAVPVADPRAAALRRGSLGRGGHPNLPLLLLLLLLLPPQ